MIKDYSIVAIVPTLTQTGMDGVAVKAKRERVRSYVDLLKETFMLDQVQPYVSNLKKRIVKAPKVYLSDVGIANVLLGVQTFDDLQSGTKVIAVTNLAGLSQALSD